MADNRSPGFVATGVFVATVNNPVAEITTVSPAF